MTALLSSFLLMTFLSTSYGAQSVVSNTCKGDSSGPCEIVLETKSTGPAAMSATVTTDAFCERYSTPQRVCTQSGISVDSTVVHGSANGSGPTHISTSVLVVSDGGSNSISESYQLPPSVNTTTTRRIVCACTQATVSPPTPRTTTAEPPTVPVVVVGDKENTVLPATVLSSDQYSDRMAKAIQTAVKENAEFAEKIRKSRLAFNQ
ncbi:hypothetical protein PMAYCL1PPCAC_04231 [Pristionchus mayeri]|uniref:Uncharacterized protein n=1 Tax=Pristionchus mayeri TaxID=1317129 RepID=A0AAN4Z4T1_9BILA|nr:hypothetical protein PMAYCL1PPCAC_04231 [Pristionchus mayeri]